MRKRNTVQRELVMNAVQRLRNHPTAEQVYEQIHPEHPSVGLGTVYRNLSALSEEGQLIRVAFPGEADHFDHTLHPHYHALCRECRRVFDVEGAPLPQVDAGQFEAHGFRVESCELLFRGLCPDCAAREAENSDDHAAYR